MPKSAATYSKAMLDLIINARLLEWHILCNHQLGKVK